MTVEEWLIAGGLGMCLAGYLLALAFGPLRNSFVDGFRCVRCHPELYWAPGVLGSAYVFFDLAREMQQRIRLGEGSGPIAPVHPIDWRFPDFQGLAGGSLAGVLEHVAGTFHVAVTAGPLGSVAAVCLLMNWRGSNSIMRRALLRRFPRLGWPLYFALLLSAVAAIVRTGMFFAIDFFAAREDTRQWLFYAGFVDAFGWAFEHLAGAFVQVCLLLVALVWVRGLSLDRTNLVQFSLRRFAYVLPWLGLVVAVGVLATQGPVLATGYHPAALAQVLPVLPYVSIVLHLAMLLFPTMQINMTVENKSLRRALEQNGRFFRAHGFHYLWFLVLSLIPFYAMAVADGALRETVGDWSIAFVVWRALAPWVWALPIGWVLATWVCFDRACEVDRLDRGVQY